MQNWGIHLSSISLFMLAVWKVDHWGAPLFCINKRLIYFPGSASEITLKVFKCSPSHGPGIPKGVNRNGSGEGSPDLPPMKQNCSEEPCHLHPSVRQLGLQTTAPCSFRVLGKSLLPSSLKQPQHLILKCELHVMISVSVTSSGHRSGVNVRFSPSPSNGSSVAHLFKN